MGGRGVVTWERDEMMLYSKIVTVWDLATLSPSRIDLTINGPTPLRAPSVLAAQVQLNVQSAPFFHSLSHHWLLKPIVSRESGGVTSLPPTGQSRAGTESTGNWQTRDNFKGRAALLSCS